jgi:DNA-binding NtrC family response regulator
LPAVLKVDFFGHAHGAFDDAEFERRRLVEVRPGTALYVKSPEDSMLRKLVWFREGGEVSDRQ